MADPSSAYVPRTGDIHIFSTGPFDNAIENAVAGTSGTPNFTSWDDMRLAADVNLIDGTYGTIGTTPTQTEHMRGYPKTTVNMQYQTDTNSHGVNGTYQDLFCEPILLSSVGYDITINLFITENPDGASPSVHSEWFTIPKGLTTVETSSLTPDGGDRYQLNTVYQQPTEDSDILMHCAPGSDEPIAFLPTTPNEVSEPSYQVVLDYVASAQVYLFNLNVASSTSCSTCVLTTPISAYGIYPAIVQGNNLWTSTALTTEIANGQYGKATSQTSYEIISYPGIVAYIVGGCTKPPPSTVFFTIYNYGQSSCGGAVGGSFGIYGPDSTLGVGDRLFFHSGGTQELSTGYYLDDVTSPTDFRILTYVKGTGITTTRVCFEHP